MTGDQRNRARALRQSGFTAGDVARLLGVTMRDVRLATGEAVELTEAQREGRRMLKATRVPTHLRKVYPTLAEYRLAVTRIFGEA